MKTTIGKVLAVLGSSKDLWHGKVYYEPSLDFMKKPESIEATRKIDARAKPCRAGARRSREGFFPGMFIFENSLKRSSLSLKRQRNIFGGPTWISILPFCQTYPNLLICRYWS